MNTRLHYSDVLTGVTGKMVSTRGVDGMYAIFDAVAGPGVTTLAIAYLSKPVREYLAEKFPQYATEKVADELKVAIDLWRSETPEKKRTGDNLKPYLDRYVLPLVGAEYVEVPHMGDEAVNKLGGGYGDYLKETLKDKQVIAVVAPK